MGRFDSKIVAINWKKKINETVNSLGWHLFLNDSLLYDQVFTLANDQNFNKHNEGRVYCLDRDVYVIKLAATFTDEANCACVKLLKA